MAVSDPPNSEFSYAEDFQVDDEVKRAFDVNGYVLIRKLLSKEEVQRLKSTLEGDDSIIANHHYRSDGEGGRAQVCMWRHPGNDITGMIARAEKVAGTFEQLLGGEVYHYHSKLIMKEARTGGAHVWHQDYGYWYQNGCIFPHMGTAWIAVDRADKQNGCLKILQGSQRVGRINHVKVEEQAGADVSRVQLVQRFCPLKYVEVDPGDCLFFHCNLLHRSDKNDSDRRRWAFLIAYNRADNNPAIPHHLPQYMPLHKVPNSAIMECSPLASMEGKNFFTGPIEDRFLSQLPKEAA